MYDPVPRCNSLAFVDGISSLCVALHTATVFLGTVDKLEGFFNPFFCTEQLVFFRMLMVCFFSRFSSFHNISAKVKTLTQLLQNIDFIHFKATQEVQLHWSTKVLLGFWLQKKFGFALA